MSNENGKLESHVSLNNPNSFLAEQIGFDEEQEIMKSERSVKTQPLKIEKLVTKNQSLTLNDRSEINIYQADLPIHSQKKEEVIKMRKTSADNFECFLNESGVNSSFQLIFSEIIYKKIPVEDHFSYAAGRLRQIARDVEAVKIKIINK